MMMMLDEELRLIKENEELRQEIRDLIFHCMKGEVDRSLLNDLGTKDLGSLVDKYLKEVTRRRETGESSSSLLPLPYVVVNHVVAPIDIEAHKESAHISCQPLYDFYYDELPKKIDAFIADAKAKSNKSVNENVGVSSDPNPKLDEIQSFLDMLRAQRRDSRERKASMEGSHKQASTSTLICSRCMSPIPTAAAADATTGHMSSTITTAAATDATTGHMSSTITTAPAEDATTGHMSSTITTAAAADATTGHMSSTITTAAAADATTGHMSSTITTAPAEDATTGHMSSTITTAPAEDVCAPNITNNP